MELFDTHAHLDFKDYDDLPEVLEASSENNVSQILNVGIDIDSSRASLQLARDYEEIYAAAGIHPNNGDRLDDQGIEVLRMLAADKKLVAIGEIGLDNYRDRVSKRIQQEAFCKQIALAKELGLPMVIHDREAHRDIVNILRKEQAYDVGGVFHCFSGDWNMAKWGLDNNFLIAIGGVVTFKNAHDLRDVASRLPRDGMLLETDCPFLAPEPKRGKRNEPAYLRYTAGYISALRKTSLEEIAYFTTLNGRKLFSI